MHHLPLSAYLLGINTNYGRARTTIGDISDDQVDGILDNPPTLERWYGGKRLVLSMRIRNSSDIVLDNRDATLEIINLENNKTRGRHFVIPDFAPKEVEEQTF